jgi:hypothetical protein
VLSRRQLVHDQDCVWKIGEGRRNKKTRHERTIRLTGCVIRFGTGSICRWATRDPRRRALVQKRDRIRRSVDLQLVPAEVNFHALDANPQRWQRQGEKTKGQIHSQEAQAGWASVSPRFRWLPRGGNMAGQRTAGPRGFIDPPINLSPARNRRALINFLARSFLTKSFPSVCVLT